MSYIEELETIEEINMNSESFYDISDISENWKTLQAITSITCGDTVHRDDVDYRADDSMYVISRNNRKIPFQKLSDLYLNHIKKLEQQYVCVDNDEKILNIQKEVSNLQNKTIRDRCHELSIFFAKKHGGDIATGFITKKYPEYQGLYSWVEKDGYCIDYTNNLIMLKDYYYLFVDEVLNIVPQSEVGELYEDKLGTSILKPALEEIGYQK